MKINFLSKYLKHLVLYSKMQKTKNGQFFQAKVLAYLLFLNIIYLIVVLCFINMK